VIDQVWRFTPGGRQDSNGISITDSSDVLVEGVTILNPVGYHIGIGGSKNVTIRNTNSFSVSQWADGIDSMSSSHLTIDNVFVRSSDDSIALYCGRWTFKGDSTDVTVSNSDLRADVAHPIFMGVHATPGGHEQLRNVRFRNSDILEHHQPGPDYQGCMAINAGDSITVRDISFEDIRVEPFTLGQLLSVRVFKNGDYNAEPGRGISDVTFRNVSYTGTQEDKSVIEGYDPTRTVSDVTFENLRVRDRMIVSPADANTHVGEHVEGIRFIATKPAP